MSVIWNFKVCHILLARRNWLLYRVDKRSTYMLVLGKSLIDNITYNFPEKCHLQWKEESIRKTFTPLKLKIPMGFVYLNHTKKFTYYSAHRKPVLLFAIYSKKKSICIIPYYCSNCFSIITCRILNQFIS